MSSVAEVLAERGLRIYIPTYRRERQLTLSCLHESLHPFVYLVVDEQDYKVLEGKVGSANLLICPEQGKSLGAVRKWIVDEDPAEYFFMFDDNMVFCRRISDDPNDFHLAGTRDSKHFDHDMSLDMIQEMLDLMDSEVRQGNKVYAVGLSFRQKNNTIQAFTKENQRLCLSGIMNRRAFEETGINFCTDGRFKVCEDYYISLSFMTKGYKNVVMFRYCFNKAGSNLKGGCSEFRTAEVQAQSMKELKEAFPDYVKLVERSTKNWKGMGATRVDAIISWKKAYESASAPKQKSLF